MDLSIGKLQQLVTVARIGSFSKAALELNISQPALSRSIAGIEERYGFQIFNRLGHGVELTAAGAQVIEQAQSLLQTMRVFDNNLKLFGSGKAGTLAMGLSPLLASQVMSRFAVEFVKSTAQAQLQVMIRPGEVLVDALKNDLVELFFFPESYIDTGPEIEMEPIGHIMPAVVVRRGHPLAKRKHLSVEDLSGYPWASSVEPPVDSKVLNAARVVCDNYHILRDAVLESDLVCICSASFVARQLADGSLHEIRVEGLPLPSTQIYLATLSGRVRSPLAEQAVMRMREYLN